jgi:uncharacterized protein
VTEAGPEAAAGLPDRLRAALADALRRRDRIAVSALRSALSAISNAEAVAPGPPAPGAASVHIAGARAGLGAGEAGRRRLSPADMSRIVAGEISERRAAADAYERQGQPERAASLRREADILAAAAPNGAPGSRPLGEPPAG